MPFQKGHTYSKGKGRGSNAKVIEKIKEALEEKVTQEALIALSQKIIYKRLKKLEEDDKPSHEKEFAMPIALKGITDKKDITSNGESLRIVVEEYKKKEE